MTLKQIPPCAAAALLLVGASSCTQEWPSDPPDVARPEIVTVSPADATLMVPVATGLTLTFSEQMDLGTVNACTEVHTGAGLKVPGSWSGSDRTYVFTPAAALETSTRYTVTVKGGFDEAGKWLGPGTRDVHGNSLGTAFHSGFTTAGPYGSTVVYLGKSDAFGESGGETGLGVMRDFTYSTTGAYAGDGEIGLALSPSRQELYVANASSQVIDVLNPATAVAIASIALPDSTQGPAFIEFTPDGAEAWVLCRTGNHAVVINTASRSVSHVLPLASSANNGTLLAMKINHAGSRGYISTGSGYSIIVVDVTAKTVITTVPDLAKNADPWAKVEAVAVTPDDAKVIVACDYALPQLIVIDAGTNTVAQDLYLDPLYNSDTFLYAKGNVLYALGRWGVGLQKVDLASLTVTATNAAFSTESNAYGWMLGMTVGQDGVVYCLTYDGQLVLCKESDLSQLAILPAAIRKNLVAY